MLIYQACGDNLSFSVVDWWLYEVRKDSECLLAVLDLVTSSEYTLSMPRTISFPEIADLRRSFNSRPCLCG